ncbi:MAG: GGDEF domain-containing protein [Solirubrobacterales bacterium]
MRSDNGHRNAAALRAQLARVEGMREQIAKSWLVEVILSSPLAEVERMPLAWATGELPDLVSDVLAAVGEEGSPRLSRAGMARVNRLAERRAGCAPAQLLREISALQGAILATLRDELPASEPELFADSAERLAAIFGAMAGAATETLLRQGDPERDALTGLRRPGQMRSRLDQLVESHRRYGHPFALVLLDIEGPGTRGEPDDPGRESVLAIVAAALRDSVRLVDEVYRLEDDELCVLAPEQTTAEGMRIAERLAEMLAGLEAAGGIRITASAGVISCPEHGDDPERLLRKADTAMWRARATGQAAAAASVQDR